LSDTRYIKFVIDNRSWQRTKYCWNRKFNRNLKS